MKMTTLAERHFRFRFHHDRPARQDRIPCLSRGDIEEGGGIWHVEWMDGWQVSNKAARPATFAFPMSIILAWHREMHTLYSTLQ